MSLGFETFEKEPEFHRGGPVYRYKLESFKVPCLACKDTINNHIPSNVITLIREMLSPTVNIQPEVKDVVNFKESNEILYPLYLYMEANKNTYNLGNVPPHLLEPIIELLSQYDLVGYAKDDEGNTVELTDIMIYSLKGF